MREQAGEKTTGLTRRAIHAGTSAALMTVIENGLLLLRTLILSRLLSPREFGLMGMAYIAILTSDVLSQTGFGRAIVQRRGDPGPYLDTIWCVAVIRGLVLGLVVLGCAPLLGAFFKTPEVVPVVGLIALGPVLLGFNSPRWLLLERDLHLARFSLPRVVGGVADLIVTTLLAWHLRSVYALAVGYLINSFTTMWMTFVVGPYRPRLRLDTARARELYAFGKHIFRLDVLTYAVDQVERVTVGRLRDATQFGLYAFAFRMATLPTAMLFTTMVRVVFPSFAWIQNEPARVRAAFLRVMGLVAVISLPMATGLVTTADLLVPIAFGEAWTPMVPAFQVLCVMSCLVTLGQICGAVAGGVGQAAVPAQGSMLRLAALALPVIPATIWYGIVGTAWCSAAAAAASTLYLLIVMGRRLRVTARDYLEVFRVPVAGCLSLAIVVSIAGRGLHGLPPAAALTALIIAGAATYIVCAGALDRLTGSAVLTSLRSLRRPVS